MQHKCNMCSYVYGEEGVNPETGEKNPSWHELPEDWVCPKCNVPKSDFKAVEEDNEDDSSDDGDGDVVEDEDEEEDSDDLVDL